MNRKLISKCRINGMRRNIKIKNSRLIRTCITGKMGFERRFLKYWWRSAYYREL
jgi:hypothetical protein